MRCLQSMGGYLLISTRVLMRWRISLKKALKLNFKNLQNLKERQSSSYILRLKTFPLQNWMPIVLHLICPLSIPKLFDLTLVLQKKQMSIISKPRKKRDFRWGVVINAVDINVLLKIVVLLSIVAHFVLRNLKVWPKPHRRYCINCHSYNQSSHNPVPSNYLQNLNKFKAILTPI